MGMKDNQTNARQNGLQANEIEAKNKVTLIVKPRAIGDGESGKNNFSSSSADDPSSEAMTAVS